MLSRQDIEDRRQQGLVVDADVSLEPSSLDLHLAFVIDFDEHGKSTVRRAEDAPIVLGPGRIVTFVSRERIHMPDDLGGIVFLPNSIAQRGILAFNAVHVDPGFNGRLNLRILNLSGHDYVVKPGLPFATLLFFSLSRATDKPFKRNVSDEKYIQDLEAIVLKAGGTTYAPPLNIVEESVEKILPKVLWRSSPVWVLLVLTFLILIVAGIQTVNQFIETVDWL